MSSEAPSAPLDLKIGSTVIGQDGHSGRVARLVLEPETMRVTHVVLAYGVLHHQVVVPIERFMVREDDQLGLDLDRASLAELPHFAAIEYALPDPAWSLHAAHYPSNMPLDPRATTPHGVPLPAAEASLYISGHTHQGVPGGEVPVGRGTRVVCSDGRLGRLDHLLLDPGDDTIQAVVVHRGSVRGRDVVVPADRVGSITEEEIRLTTSRSQVADLPEYHAERA